MERIRRILITIAIAMLIFAVAVLFAFVMFALPVAHGQTPEPTAEPQELTCSKDAILPRCVCPPEGGESSIRPRSGKRVSHTKSALASQVGLVSYLNRHFQFTSALDGLYAVWQSRS